MGRFLRDEQGNFSIMFSVVIFTLLITVGAAVDISRLYANKQKAADIADSTALGAALVAREGQTERLDTANRHFDGNKALKNSEDINNNPVIIFDDNAKEVSVEVTATTNFILMGLLGYDNLVVKSKATVGYAIDYVPPISIAFAFDTSGSMGDLTTDGQVKIDALKQATGDLFQAMFDASEQPDLLEDALSTSFSTYNTNIIIDDRNRGGYEHILDTMNSDPLFIPLGGTNSTPSVQFAVDELVAENAAESDPKWSGHLIFMTDGNNNDPQFNTDTAALCDSAKAQGYKVYTVAFALDATIPAARNLLENCASDTATFFESADATALQDSFRLIGERLGEATVRLKS